MPKKMAIHVQEYKLYLNLQKTEMDNFQHKGLRKKLIKGIREKGIQNEDVLDALSRVPRSRAAHTTGMPSAVTRSAFLRMETSSG